MKTTPRVTIALAAVLTLAGAALADPTVSITSPADGTTISRSASPQTIVSGDAMFEEPAISNRNLYLRYDGDASTCGSTYLSDANGPDGGNGCAPTLATLSLTPDEDDGWGATYASGGEVATPLTIDADRNIQGTFAYVTFLPDAPIFDVEVLFDDQVVGRQRHNPGTQAGINVTRTFNLNIDIPASFDKKDVGSVVVNWIIQQSATVAGSTWFEHDSPASYVSLPTYTASFNRKVEVAVDNGSFAAATLSDDLSSWTRTIATPSVGAHLIKARAVQGGKVSGLSQISLNVTS